MLKLIAVFVVALLGRLLGHASGYEIAFREGRPLLERGGKKPETQIETIYRGEKLFERFAWRGALEALGPFLESIRCLFQAHPYVKCARLLTTSFPVPELFYRVLPIC
jgi:membrane protein DedA with SNARE-associated domain